MGLEPVARRLLRDEAYDVLRDAIVSGELAPGQRISDGQIAAELGLSRAPVRQALSRLAAERLVVSKPQSHTCVAPVVPRELEDALVVVRAMHELAVREALPRMTDDDIALMRAEYENLRRAVEAGDAMAVIRADEALHAVPVRVRGNRALEETVRRYTPVLRRSERRCFSVEAASASLGRHGELIAACAAGDAATAQLLTAKVWDEMAYLIRAETPEGGG